MKARSVAVALSLFFAGGTVAQEWRYPVALGDGIGLIDETGELAAQVDAEAVRTFSGDRGPARKDGRWGYVDDTGAWAINPSWLEATPFVGDLARVREERGWVVIDRAGTVVTPRAYGELRPSDSDRFPALDPGSGLWGLLGTDGSWIVEPTFDGAGSYSEGLFPVQRYRRMLFIKLDRRWGFSNASGDLVIEPVYTSVRAFDEGSAMVTRDNNEARFVNHSGDLQLVLSYPVVFPFRDDRSRVGDGEAFGYVNREGEEVIPIRYEVARDFSSGRAAVQENGRWGYIGPDGGTVVPAVLDAAYAFDGPLARIVMGGEPRYIDTSGRTVWPKN